MAMISRNGGVFEDFKPTSEWQQNAQSHILTISLPAGFIKEQIKVSTEDRNTIRVRGERPVAGNKWSRFLDDFQVPNNFEMGSVRAQYQGGTLTITVPKKFTTITDHIPPQNTVDKNSERRKGLLEGNANSAKKMKLEKNGGTTSTSKIDKESNGKQIKESNSGDYRAITMDKYKKAVKGLYGLNEERQLVVNVGAAVLVIVAIGAYVTYKSVSQKDAN